MPLPPINLAAKAPEVLTVDYTVLTRPGFVFKPQTTKFTKTLVRGHAVSLEQARI